MNQSEVGNKIIEVASNFINLHEIVSNSEWNNKELSAEIKEWMKNAGWQAGWPYCASFCEAIWRKALTDLKAPADVLKEFATTMSPSSQASYEGFKKIGKTEFVPVPGSIFFMRLGSDPGKGHAGIVKEYNASDKTIITVEGNTGAKSGIGSTDREGDGIYSKKRVVSFEKSKKSLYFLGFINPPSWK